MTPLRLFVNAIVGGFLLFAWSNFAPVFFGDPPGAIGLEHEEPVFAALKAQAGDPYSFGRTLAAYLADCACALAAGWFLVLVAPRVRSLRWRVAFVASLGLFASLAADFPLWNHSGFPGIWLLGRTAENVLGFTLVGLFLAWRMKTYRFVPQKTGSTR
jgi:hypothetical protein